MAGISSNRHEHVHLAFSMFSCSAADRILGNMMRNLSDCSSLAQVEIVDVATTLPTVALCGLEEARDVVRRDDCCRERLGKKYQRTPTRRDPQINDSGSRAQRSFQQCSAHSLNRQNLLRPTLISLDVESQQRNSNT